MTTLIKPPLSIIARTPPRPTWRFYAGAFGLLVLAYVFTLFFADLLMDTPVRRSSETFWFILVAALCSLLGLIPFSRLMSWHHRTPAFHQLLLPGALAFPLGWWISADYFFWLPFAVIVLLAAITAVDRKLYLPALLTLLITWMYCLLLFDAPSPRDLSSLVGWPLIITISAFVLYTFATVVSFLSVTAHIFLSIFLPAFAHPDDQFPHDSRFHLASYGGLSYGIILTVILGAIFGEHFFIYSPAGFILATGFTVLPNLIILSFLANRSQHRPESFS